MSFRGDKRRLSGGYGMDDPPLSRLFIVGPKDLSEEDYRKAFSEFGSIEELWMIKDKNTQQYKGVTYIKFSKTSEAAKALETKNGKSLTPGTRKIKIMIAANRDKGSSKDNNEEEKAVRLFIMIPKNMTDDELADYFKQFGELEYAYQIKDRNSGESKGVAYVKYHKFSDAAEAYEKCDRKYKPVFAEPKKSQSQNNVDFSSFLGSKTGSSSNIFMPPTAFNDGYSKLQVLCNPCLTEDQLWRLFDIIPGLDYCQIKYEGGFRGPPRAVGEVTYKQAQWAAHAKEKLHGFEYPPGCRLVVKPIYDRNDNRRGDDRSEQPKRGIGSLLQLNEQQPRGSGSLLQFSGNDSGRIAEAVAQATSIIQAAGLNPAALINFNNMNKDNSLSCSVQLPEPKPMVHIDSQMKARCFIVCTPSALPNSVIKDLFCRFGSCIDAYLLANRNCGYAKYSDEKAAEEAIETLHGAEVNGIRLKVLQAEEQRKRPRTDDNKPEDLEY